MVDDEQPKANRWHNHDRRYYKKTDLDWYQRNGSSEAFGKGTTLPDGSTAAALAVGNQANATGDESTAIGQGANATGERSIAIGHFANSTVDDTAVIKANILEVAPSDGSTVSSVLHLYDIGGDKTSFAIADDGTLIVGGEAYPPGPGTAGAATWGEITGTLSNQTDLDTALDAKTDESDFTAYKLAHELTHLTVVDSTDTDASGFGFVIDEDSMSSNSATKVPTQQSVKAYVDAQTSGGGATWGSITGTLSNQTDLDNALDAKVSTTQHNSDLAVLEAKVPLTKALASDDDTLSATASTVGNLTWSVLGSTTYRIDAYLWFKTANSDGAFNGAYFGINIPSGATVNGRIVGTFAGSLSVVPLPTSGGLNSLALSVNQSSGYAEIHATVTTSTTSGSAAIVFGVDDAGDQLIVEEGSYGVAQLVP